MFRAFSVRRVLLPFVVVISSYAWWVNGQYSRLNELNQQELQDGAAELKRVIENAVGAFGNFRPEQAVEAGATNHPACVFDEQQPYLEFDGKGCDGEQWDYKTPLLSTAEGLQIVTPHPDPAPAAKWKLRLDALFADLAFSDAFELIFVADDTGKVLYQTTPRNRPWRRLLRWGERAFEDTGAKEPGGLRVQDLSSLIGKDAVPGWSRLQAVSDRTTVTVAGQSHQLYLQPVTGESGIKLRLVFGALVPTQLVLRRALAMDTYFVAVIVVAALALVFGIPFLKLASMSAHERFRARDVYALYLSCAALVTLATMIVISYDSYHRWTMEADRGLHRFARDLGARIAAEVSGIRDQLEEYDARVAKYESPSPCTSTMVQASWPELDPSAPLVLPRTTNVFIEQVSWINPAGRQVWKLASDEIGALRVVTQRPYFQAILSGHAYRDSSASSPFFIAPDRSIADGRFYTFLSIPSKLDGACAALRPHGAHGEGAATGYVAVVNTRLLSTEYPALPVGYGFAVVTRDGRALYHSDARLVLRENFFDHLDRADAARAIAQSGRPGSLAANYREVPHQFEFIPLPWWLATDPASVTTPTAGIMLIAFRDVSTVQAIVARTFVVSLVPMLLIVAAVGVCLWLAGAVSKQWQGGASRWLWPHGGLAPMYKIMAAAVATLIVMFVATTEWTTRVWPYLLLPACAAVSALAAQSGSWHSAPRRALDSYGWYTCELTLLALAMVVVPVAAIANLTLGHEFGVLIQAEQQRMRAQSADAALALRADARSLSYPDFVGAEMVATHASWQRPRRPDASERAPVRPSPFDQNLDDLGQGDRHLVGAHDWLNRWLPAESPLLARLRYDDVPGRYTPLGSLGSLSWFGAAGISLIVVFLATWIRWSARHLHAADVMPSAAIADADVDACWDALDDEDRLVLLQVTAERIANPRQLGAITALAAKGFITLAPDIQPASPAIDARLARERADGTAVDRLARWEHAHEGRSWEAVRPMLFAGLVVLAIFLAIAEPTWQSQIVGVSGSVAAVGGSLQKLRDLVVSWLTPKPGPANA